MKLHPKHIDQASLMRLGREASSMFEQNDFQSLADRFDYAFAYGRTAAAAIEEDFRSCLAEVRALPESRPRVLPSVRVKYFEPNASGLFALIECLFIAEEGCPILAELVVTSYGMDKYMILEEVSLATQ